MNHDPRDSVEALVAARLEGLCPEIPDSKRSEVEQAVQAHAVLQAFIEETVFEAIQEDRSQRRPPQLPEEYEIKREIGKGGMGVVYLVRQHSLNRDVALKVLRPGEQAFGSMLRRFLGEAQHLARLRHPNIVTIHEVGDASGEPYFTMDYIDGEPLSALIQRGPMSPTQALAILKQVASGVQHAHRQGIIHRDLKPSNVLMDRDGRALVTDFGLARDVGQTSTLTQSGELLGTPQYMAPEQARGQSSLIGEATDIHALGLLLFEMLTGQAAFASSSPADVLVRLLHEDPPPLRSIDRRIPRDLETICQKMLQKSPGARYTSVSALLEDLRRFESGEPLLAKRTPVATRLLRWSTRHWKMVTASLLSAILAIWVAAPLFDKSFHELVTWGDEELATGHPDVAGKVYMRALQRATDQERPMVVDRVVQTVRSMDDATNAVELAMAVLDQVPEASFGRHDYLVAKALVTRESSNVNLGTTNPWASKTATTLDLLKKRLQLSLQGELNEAQRSDVEHVLSLIDLAVDDRGYPITQPPSRLEALPKGTMEELQRLSEEAANPWDRGKAFVALGRLHEQAGHGEAGHVKDAIDAYQHAYEWIRSVYPTYEGIKAPIGSGSRVDAADAEECRLLRGLVDTLRRLAPDSVPEPTGAIELEVIGSRLPPDVHIELVVELADPSIANPDQGLSSNLPRLLPLRQDRPVRAGVLDGTYRLRTRGAHIGWEGEGAAIGPLIEVDVDGWPETIEVRGDVIQLPAVRLRLAREITLQSPADGDAVDLSSVELRWSAIAGASLYRVQLEYRQETPAPSAVSFMTADAKNPRLRFIDLDSRQQAAVRKNLTLGRTGAWQVDAYDDTGRRIGRTVHPRRFLIAAELTE